MRKVTQVKSGERVRTSTGEVIKVLNSNPEGRSAASASYTMWEICGYSEGNPTRRLTVDPNYEIEVVEEAK